MKKEKLISLSLAKNIAKAAKQKGVKLPESEINYCGNRLWASGDSLEDDYIPAYDTFELGEMLIEGDRTNRYDFDPTVGENFGKSGFTVWIEPGTGERRQTSAKTEPEARGKMLLYLLKNDLLK